MEDFMATTEWQQKKETFNTEKNYFDITYVTVSRETSEEEIRLERLSSRYDTWGMIIGIFGIILGLFGCSSLGALGFWLAFCITAVVSISSMIIGFFVLLNKGLDCDRQLDKYLKENDVWNTPEVQELERYNKEQNDFAAKWRADHPLEEKIRACIKDPMSSVDIANLARYYAEEYIKDGVSHETVDR
jgi:amino acid permease